MFTIEFIVLLHHYINHVDYTFIYFFIKNRLNHLSDEEYVHFIVLFIIIY